MDMIVFFLLLHFLFDGQKTPFLEFQQAVVLELSNFVFSLNKLQHHGFSLLVQGTILEEFLPKFFKAIKLSDVNADMFKLCPVELNRRAFLFDGFHQILNNKY